MKNQFQARWNSNIKRRRGNGCNFIKNKEYKYILGKSMPPDANLSLFLIISSKNNISHSKFLTKSAATVVFFWKVSQNSSFKKDQSIQLQLFHCIVILPLCLFTNISLLFVKLPLFSKIKTQFLLHMRKKKLNLSFLGEYSLDISTYIPILDSLLVHVY